MISRLLAGIIFLAVLVQGTAAAATDRETAWPETEFSGFLESRHSIQTRSPNDTLASETLARLELTAYGERNTLFASLDVSENHLMGEDSGISLHEGYLDLNWERLSLRAGRQIIIWGSSDGVRITDNISPVDYSEYITRSFDELRMGVDALNLKYAGDLGTTQLIWIPRYRSGISPSPSSPWCLAQPPSDLLPADEPETGFEDAEAAVKYALFLPGADLALSYFYTWNDTPVYESVTLGDGSGATRQVYHRIHIFGAEFSRPWNDFVFRTEAALFHGMQFTPAVAGLPLEKKDQLKWMVGLDWYPGNNWTALVQYSRERILSPDAPGGLARTVRSDTLVLSLNKTLFREKLTLSGTVYLDPDIRDSLTRLSGEYQVMDNLSIFLGSDIFSGDRDGRFGCYRDNTQVWTKLKFYF